MKNKYRQFAYLGDRDTVTQFGIEFPRGVAVSVEDPAAVGKLAGNPDFSETVDGCEVLPATTQPAPRADDVEDVIPREASPGRHVAKHKGRGKYEVQAPDGSTVASGLTREEAEAQAAQLNGD